MEVPAGQSLPLAAPSGAAGEAIVMVHAATSGAAAGSPGPSPQQQHVLLQSQPFSLDSSGEGESEDGSATAVQLVLRPPPPPMSRSSSRLWGGAAAAAAEDKPGGDAGLECRLAARVEARSLSTAGGAAAAASVGVVVTAGCFVSNLTGLPLAMLAEGAAEADVATAARYAVHLSQQEQETQQQAQHSPSLLPPESSTHSLPDSIAGRSARHSMLLPPAATVPLMHLWRSVGGGGLGRHRRQSSWGATTDMFRSFSGGLLPSQQQAGGTAGAAGRPALRVALAAPADTTDADLPSPQLQLQQRHGYEPGAAGVPASRGAWSSALDPYAAAGRQRLYLMQPDAAAGGGGGGAVMLTYRVLLSGGCFHLVLFRCAGGTRVAAGRARRCERAPSGILLPQLSPC